MKNIMMKSITFTVVAGLVLALGVTAQAAVLFSVDHDNLPAIGASVETWDGFTSMQEPTVVGLGGEKWYSNKYASGDGMVSDTGNHAAGTTIPINGATIVTAVSPERHSEGNWCLVVDIFYDQLCLGIHNTSGQVTVKVNGANADNYTWLGDVIPEEPGVLTLTVGNEANPAFEVFWQGENDPAPISMGTGNGNTGGQPYTALYAQAKGPYAAYINLGRNNPDGWSTYNGLIGDTIVFDEQLSPEELLDVQTQVLVAMGIQKGTATKPSPSYGSLVSTANPLTLSWTNLDPTEPGDDIYVDVWWGTDPCALTQIIDAESINSTDVDSSAVDTYYWRVDSYNNVADANGMEGKLWSYTTTPDAAPTVVIETPDQMTWAGEGVPLDVTVTDDDRSPLTIEWTADLPGGITAAYNPGNDVADTTVTFTKVAYTEADIVNPGFEAVILDDDGWGGAPGWDHVDGANADSWNPPATVYAIIPEGNNVAWAGLGIDAAGNGGLSQVLTETLASDTVYELNVKVGKNSVYDWPGYKVQLLAGETVLEEDNNNLNPAIGTFATSTVTFDSTGVDEALVGQPLQIRLLVIAAPGDYGEMNFDDVRLTADPGFSPPTGVQTVTVTVAVSDEYNSPATDTASIEIDVYDDACHMAKVAQGRSAITDFNGNCITDIEELAVMLAAWLDDYSVTGSVDRP